MLYRRLIKLHVAGRDRGRVVCKTGPQVPSFNLPKTLILDFQQFSTGRKRGLIEV